jgi:two-component system OmpR family response regulator
VSKPNPLHFKTQVVPHPKRQILHIEDDEEYGNLVRTVLESKDYKVTQATDGLSGLIAFNNNVDEWDAVILDLHLPHVSGTSLLKEMHRLRPKLPLIVLTGDMSDSNLGLYEEGAVILWHKPISVAELLENLKVLMH